MIKIVVVVCHNLQGLIYTFQIVMGQECGL